MTLELSTGSAPGVLAALPGARRPAGRAHSDDTTDASNPKAHGFRRALAEAQPERVPTARASDATKDTASTAAAGPAREPASARIDASAERNGRSARPAREMPVAGPARGARDVHEIRDAPHLGDDGQWPAVSDAEDASAGSSLPGPADPALALAQAGLLSVPTPTSASTFTPTPAPAHASMPTPSPVLPTPSAATVVVASTHGMAALGRGDVAPRALPVAPDAAEAASIPGLRVETGSWAPPPSVGSPLAATPALVAARAVRADIATGAPPASFTITSATMTGPTPATLLLQRGAMGDEKTLAAGTATAGTPTAAMAAVASGAPAGSGTNASDATGPGVDAMGSAALAASVPAFAGLGTDAVPIQSPSRRGMRSGAGGEAEGTTANAPSGSGASSGPAFAAPIGTANTAPAGATEPAATALLDAFGWWMSQKTQAAELTLDVGGQPVSVSVKVQGHEAQVVFRSDAPEARQALAQALPQLREMLGGEGLMLAGAFVGGQAAGDGSEARREHANMPAPDIARAQEREGHRPGAITSPAAQARGAASLRALDLYV